MPELAFLMTGEGSQRFRQYMTFSYCHLSTEVPTTGEYVTKDYSKKYK